MSKSQGNGTIRKRTSRRAGRKTRIYFEAELLLGRRVDGTRERIGKSFPTEAAARTWLHDQRMKRQRGVAQGSAVPIVGELLTDWMAHLEAIDRTPATLHGYRSVIAAHLRPTLGAYRLDDPT